MAEFIVKKISPQNYNDWDKFLAQSPQRTVFSTSHWLTAMAESFGFGIAIYGCFKASNLMGGCPMLVRKKIGLSFSVPKEMLMPYQSIIFGKTDFKHSAKIISQNFQILDALSRQLQKDFAYISLIHHPSIVDTRPFLWQNWKAKLRYNFIIKLDSEEKVYSRFRRNIKKQISKGDRNQITIFKSDNIENFYKLVKKSYKKKHHHFPIPQDVLSNLLSKLMDKNLAQIYYATNNQNQILSARIILKAFDTAHDWLAGADPEFNDTGATPYLIWHILKENMEEYQTFDFGGATYLPSIARFKSHFGGELVPYFVTEKYSSTFVKSLIKLHQLAKLR